MATNSRTSDGLPLSSLLSSLGENAELGKQISLAVLSGIGVALSAGVVLDIYQDWIPEGKPLWSTLIENALPLLFALLLPYAALLLARSPLGEEYVSETAKWAVVGALATLFVASVGVGLQLVQGELKPSSSSSR